MPSILSLGMNQPPAQQVEGGRVGVREQCGERQLAPCSAELLRGLDGGVGLHCGTGHRGVPGRGATAVGLVGLLRMVPSAVLAPLAAPLADRGRRERVLVLVSSIRGVAAGAAGIVVALDEPVLIVYVLAALATVAGTLYRPAHSALLPSLCRTGQELTSANVVRGMLDSVATLAGPLLAAVLVEFTGVAAVFAVAAGARWPPRPCYCDCAMTPHRDPLRHEVAT